MEEEKSETIKIRIEKSKKTKWKNRCSEKNITLSQLIIGSVEERLFDDERRKILTFIEKQDNIFKKVENNINQFAKVANSQKHISENELKIFSKKLRKNLVVKKKPLTFANAFANKRKLRNKK